MPGALVTSVPFGNVTTTCSSPGARVTQPIIADVDVTSWTYGARASTEPESVVIPSPHAAVSSPIGDPRRAGCETSPSSGASRCPERFA